MPTLLCALCNGIDYVCVGVGVYVLVSVVCNNIVCAVHVQYRSDARYKARVIYAFARGGKRTCTLRQIHYTQLNGFIQGDKRVYTRRQTRLPYTLHLICTVCIYSQVTHC